MISCGIGFGCLGREELVRNAQLYSSQIMSFLNELRRFRGLALTNFQLGIDEGDEGANSQAAGTILFKQKVEIEGTGGRPGHDEDEEVTLEKYLAGEVIVGNCVEVAAFLLREVGGVEGGGFRWHWNSFHYKCLDVFSL